MKKAVLLLFLVCAAHVSGVLACVCMSISDDVISRADQVKGAVSRADAVFIGKVGDLDWIKDAPNAFMQERREKEPGLTWESKTVVFNVDLWWKGGFNSEALVLTDQARNADGSGSFSSCDYGFEQDKTYLVFAKKEGKYLKNIACSFTRRDDQIKDILPLLGEGKKPGKPKN